MLIFLTLTVILSITTLMAEAKSGAQCDKDKYFSPYVIVKRRPGGNDIDMIDRTGFIDLSGRVNAVLCVNGPAIVLSEYQEVQNGSSKVAIFSSPTFKVYQHSCTRINKISEEEYKRLKQLKKPIKMTKDVQASNKIVGINLVGEEKDYRKATSAWFLQENFGHSIHPKQLVHDGSFAVIGNSQHFCLRVNNEFMVILESKAKSNESICLWTVNHKAPFFERYEAIFRSNKTTPMYTWQDCPLAPTPPPDPEKPIPTPNITDPDPFSIAVDPSQSNKNGGGGKGPGGKQTAQIMVQYKVDLDDCHPLPPFDPAGCVELVYGGKNSKQCDLLNQVLPADDDEIMILNGSLEWKKEIMEMIADIFSEVCEPFAPYMPYTVMRVLEFYLYWVHEGDTGGTWTKAKNPVWDFILTDLRLCRKNVKDFMWFEWKYEDLVEGENAQVKARHRRSIAPYHRGRMDLDGREDFLSENFIDYSERESRNDNPFIAYFEEMPSVGLHAGKSEFSFLDDNPENLVRERKQSTTPSQTANYIQEYFEEVKRRGPYDFRGYPTEVHHVNKSNGKTKLFYYEDTAETEYELNVGLDMAWKVWATVAGYCSQHYHPRESETFPRFFNQFYEDFFKPVIEEWTSSQDNEVLKVLLSDWNSEVGSRWLDTCLEGSYVDSKTSTFRPPRPILVKGKKSKLHANNFVDLPFFIKSKFHNMHTLSNSPVYLSFR